MLRLIGPRQRWPTGVIVGTADIDRRSPPDPADGNAGPSQRHPTAARRETTARTPKRHPQPAWVRAF